MFVLSIFTVFVAFFIVDLDKKKLSQFTSVTNLLESTAPQACSELAFDLIRSTIRNQKALEDDIRNVLADA